MGDITGGAADCQAQGAFGLLCWIALIRCFLSECGAPAARGPRATGARNFHGRGAGAGVLTARGRAGVGEAAAG